MCEWYMCQDEIDGVLNAESYKSEAEHGEAEAPGITPYVPYTQRGGTL